MRISKKFIILLAILTVLVAGVVIYDLLPLRRQPGLEAYFKGNWGMSMKNVKALYDIAPEPESVDNELVYKQTIAGRPAEIIYIFEKQGLLFKRTQLASVYCMLDIQDISITESQWLAEKQMQTFSALGFEQAYYGYAEDLSHLNNRNNIGRFRWSFYGWSRSKSTDVVVIGGVRTNQQNLMLFFYATPFLLRFENHGAWSLLQMLNQMAQIFASNDGNHIFDYAQWEDVYPSQIYAAEEDE